MFSANILFKGVVNRNHCSTFNTCDWCHWRGETRIQNTFNPNPKSQWKSESILLGVFILGHLEVFGGIFHSTVSLPSIGWIYLLESWYQKENIYVYINEMESIDYFMVSISASNEPTTKPIHLITRILATFNRTTISTTTSTTDSIGINVALTDKSIKSSRQNNLLNIDHQTSIASGPVNRMKRLFINQSLWYSMLLSGTPPHNRLITIVTRY